MMDFILAIEIGGTKLQMALGLADGSILHNHRKRIQPEKGRQGILKSVLDAMPMLHAKAKELGGRIGRIGIGYGGPIDTANGRVIGSMHVKDWEQFPLSGFLLEQTGIDTFIYNDSSAATWGEYCNGSGNGCKVFFYTNVGSGIGGGVVIDGKLYDGQGYGAAELGQTYTYAPWCDDEQGWPVKRLEEVCSGWAVEEHLRTCAIPVSSLLWELCAGTQAGLTCAMLGRAVERGDAFAAQVLDQVSRLFAHGLSNAISMFNPERIAIGGGFSLLGDKFIDRVRNYTAPLVFMSSVGRYEINKCELDEDIVLVGALRLAGAESR